jgi:hypothetical protein
MARRKDFWPKDDQFGKRFFIELILGFVPAPVKEFVTTGSASPATRSATLLGPSSDKEVFYEF